MASAHTRIDQTQQLADVGDAATVIFETETIPSIGSSGTSHMVNLEIWSGNAVIEVVLTYANLTVSGAPPPPLPSRAAQRATVRALAQTILAAMPR